MDNQLQVLVVSLACVYICSDTPGVNINNPSDAPSRNIILCVVTTTFIGIWFIEVFFWSLLLALLVLRLRSTNAEIEGQNSRFLCFFFSSNPKRKIHLFVHFSVFWFDKGENKTNSCVYFLCVLSHFIGLSFGFGSYSQNKLKIFCSMNRQHQ